MGGGGVKYGHWWSENRVLVENLQRLKNAPPKPKICIQAAKSISLHSRSQPSFPPPPRVACLDRLTCFAAIIKTVHHRSSFVSRNILASLQRRKGSGYNFQTMPRYKYTTPFYCWYQYNPAYNFSSTSLEECAANALAQHPNTLVLVNAECHIDGRDEIATAKICAWQTENRTDEEIFELLDQELDRIITNNQRDH